MRAPGQGQVRLGNLDEVRGRDGALAVIDDARLLRNAALGSASAAPVQGLCHARYTGQRVALVVAETFDDARHAATAVHVHAAGEAGPTDRGAVTPEVPDAMHLAQGDHDAAMERTAQAVGRLCTTSPMISAPLEPHPALASGEEGRQDRRHAKRSRSDVNHRFVRDA